MEKVLVRVAEANAIAAKAMAIERAVETEEIAKSEAFALHAAAFNGMPDPKSGSASPRRYSRRLRAAGFWGPAARWQQASGRCVRW